MTRKIIHLKKGSSKLDRFVKCVICGSRRKADTNRGTYYRGQYVCEKCLRFIASTDFGDDRDDMAKTL